MANTPIAQVRRLNYNGEDIGMGFNSDTGLAVGTALDFAPPAGERSQQAEGGITIITSHEQLMESLHMSAELEGRYAFSTGGAKVDYSKNSSYNSSSTFVLAKLVITNDVSRGKDFRLKPDLLRLLNAAQEETFIRAFGDSFVRAHYNGGEFYALMRITSVDSKTESKLSSSLHAAVQGGIASADFKASMETANTHESTHSEFFASFFQKGGSGAAEIGTTLDVDDIKKRLKDFPDAVKNHPFPFFIEVATYDTVPLPTPTKEQRESFLLALADTNQQKLKYIQARNDCQFAAEHPEFFFNPPPRTELLAAATEYLKLMNAAIAHAVNLSNGRIDPPQTFDPSKLTPPLTVPDVQVRKRDVGLEASFSDWWVNRDNPATLKTNRAIVHRLSRKAIDELHDFDAIADPTGDPIKTERMKGMALARVIGGFNGINLDRFGNETPLTSLVALPTMVARTVKTLDVSGNEVTDLTGIEQFPTLVSLDASSNDITDLEPLRTLSALRSLNLSNNLISDISGLAGCIGLETLDVSGNDITDLGPLAHCQRLHSLHLAGTQHFGQFRRNRWTNPVDNAQALGSLPHLANPFVLGRTLTVRYGDLTEGDAAQFRGTATRVGDSNRFRVRLARGTETLDDEWTLASVIRMTLAVSADFFALVFPSLRQGDTPTSGTVLNISLASEQNETGFNLSYVLPEIPQRCGIDLEAYPIFRTLIRFPTFDAVVEA